MQGSLLNPHHQISRREFLKIAGSHVAALLLLPTHTGFRMSGKLLPSSEEEISLGRVLENRVAVYDAPSFTAAFVKMLYSDLVVPITAITIGDQYPEHNRVWYQVENQGYAHSGSIQPVRLNLNPVLDRFPENGQLAEVTVPFTDALWNPRFSRSVAYRLYYSSTYWVTDVRQDDQGKFWYIVPDDQFGISYFVDATHLRPITAGELTPISPQVPPDQKRLEVILRDQVVIAYEGENPVFMTRAATGANFSSGDFRTPIGHFLTNRKRPSRHMADGGRAAPKSYDLPGVPWVCYLTQNGIAFHGTYWHNDFGKPRSHGCINCLSSAARWIYRWTTPVVPVDSPYLKGDNGTKVDIINQVKE